MPQVSSKSKKEEILSAYQELVQKFQERAEAAQERKSDVDRRVQAEVVKKAVGYSAEAILQNVTTLESEVRRWLSQLIESLLKEADKLREVQEAIGVEEGYLEQIHQIKVEADTLAHLIQAHKEKRRQLEENYQQKQEQLDKQILNRREEWQKEEQEYSYELGVKRKREEDDYQQKRQAKEAELKEWEQRLGAFEKELNELRKLKEEFDERLESGVARAGQETEGRVRGEEQVKAQILAEKTAATKHVAELTIESLKKSLTEKEHEVERLKKELVISNQGVKDIALKVIEGRSRLSEEHRAVRGKESRDRSESMQEEA